MFNAATVAYLRKFYTKTEIEGFWKTVGDTLLARNSDKVTITTSSVEGATASGIVLRNEAEMQAFMASCEEAIRQIDAGDTSPVNPASLGSSAAFNQRPVMV